MNTKLKIATWILLLIIIDQLIKIIVYFYFMEYRFDIIPSLLEFRPAFNSNYSHLNDVVYKRFNINIGILPHLILYAILQLIVINIYISFRLKLNNTFVKLLNIAVVLQISSLICALIGNLFWTNGVLDYLYLKPLVIFDLKDIYASTFVLLFLIYTIKNKEQMKNINLEPKDVIKYLKKTKLSSWFNFHKD